MGRVPTKNEVLAGVISDLPRGLEAGKFALQELFPNGTSRLADNGRPIFKSAGVYGSTIDGYELGKRPTIRSDLDMVIIHFDNTYNTAQRVVGSLADRIQLNFGVTLEAQLHPPGGAPEESDPLYASHIVDIGRRYPEWRVGSPADEFVNRLVSPDDKTTHMMCACKYLILKMLSFDHAEASYVGFADNPIFQRALETASAIGRKVLPATYNPDDVLPPINDKPATRAMVEEKIAENFYNDAVQVLEDMRWITTKDSEFTDVLVATLAARRAVEQEGLAEDIRRQKLKAIGMRYDDWIQDHYMEAVVRAGRLCRAWGNLIEDKLAIIAPQRMQELDDSENCSFYNASEDDY